MEKVQQSDRKILWPRGGFVDTKNLKGLDGLFSQCGFQVKIKQTKYYSP